MKLAFYYHIEIGITVTGQISAPGFLGVFLDALAQEVEEFYLVAHTYKGKDDYTLTATNVKLIDLGKRRPAWVRHLIPNYFLGRLQKDLVGVDAFLIRSPSPLAPFFSRYIPKTCQLCYYVVGSYASGADEMKPSSLRDRIIKQYLYINHKNFLDALKGRRIVVNSPELKKSFVSLCSAVEVIPSTTIAEDDIYWREDTCQGDTVNILYTGRFDWQKGMDELIRAFAELHRKNLKTKLHFVGWEDDPNKPVEKGLKEKALKNGISDVVVFHGKKKVGAELSAMYRMADIYVLPSHHEGFPRTIWEALANSLPVVATNVGAIPHYLTHEESIYLVEPKKVSELKDAMELVLKDKELRKKMIASGYAIAKENTLSHRAKQMIEYVQENI